MKLPVLPIPDWSSFSFILPPVDSLLLPFSGCTSFGCTLPGLCLCTRVVVSCLVLGLFSNLSTKLEIRFDVFGVGSGEVVILPPDPLLSVMGDLALTDADLLLMLKLDERKPGSLWGSAWKNDTFSTPNDY